MTLWFFVKTTDNPKIVGDAVCAYNVFEDTHPKGKYSWVMQEGAEKDEGEYWQIEGRYEDLKDSVTIGIVYRAGDAVVFGEVNDDLVPNFMDPLLEKYGFDNLRCSVAAPNVEAKFCVRELRLMDGLKKAF
jgi:hypothetical protein